MITNLDLVGVDCSDIRLTILSLKLQNIFMFLYKIKVKINDMQWKFFKKVKLFNILDRWQH